MQQTKEWNMRRMFGFFTGILAIAGGFAANNSYAATDARVGVFSNTSSANAQRRAPAMPTMQVNMNGNMGVNLPTTGGTTTQTAYTIDACMDDVLACVNGGALPNKINDLYNVDLRNSIFNGMSLCAAQIDKCISSVRRNGQIVYHSASDVWIDFNSRVIQPSYFSFVLQRTGLTPNQAENTCILLDKNTYGTSFTAVGQGDDVTNEYARNVGAYNAQDGGDLKKTSPQGVQANTTGRYDSQRGYYARWDATTGECLVRVAAYNKGSQISNTWLFGTLGDDKPAEVWKSAGTSFGCNKDLFGFSLLNNTSTVAVVGVGGGTLVGAGVGAIAGANSEHILDCDSSKDREALKQEIDENNLTDQFNAYGVGLVRGGEMSKSQCTTITGFQDMIAQVERHPCATGAASGEECENFKTLTTGSGLLKCTGASKTGNCVDFNTLYDEAEGLKLLLKKVSSLEAIEGGRVLKGTLIGAGVGAAAGGLATAITAFVEKNNITCHVGDGLDSIAFGKSGKIDSLKEFYVKWNLRLPDTILPTALVVDCNSWKTACGTIKDISQCAAAQVNYKPAGVQRTTLVDSACTVSGSVCIENYPVAVSNGACQ